MKLTDRQIKTAVIKDKSYKLSDGNVIGTNSDGGTTAQICVITQSDANTGYAVAQTSEQCELSIRMFSQTGGQ